MKILHYSLGLPPYRSGGMTKYSWDLMSEQAKAGNDVSVLYSGHFTLSKKTKIVKNGTKNGVGIFEIINPLPVPLLGGIKSPKRFQREIDKSIYLSFIKKISPDVIHLHTLMGLHREFLEVARELEIKTIFTSHDYFGLCPKVNFVDYENNPCEMLESSERCPMCNMNGYSMGLIYLMQSRLYRNFKEFSIVKYLRELKKSKIKNDGKRLDSSSIKIESTSKDYEELRKYHLGMFQKIDYYHFNSSIARNQYKKFLPNLKGEIIPITHSGILDRRKRRNYESQEPLRIIYIGSTEPYKGFFLLEESLKRLIDKGLKNWQISVYGKYKFPELEKIFSDADILIMPSICKETFGFTGLEAISFGVPVIVTENVGLCDIVSKHQVGLTCTPTVAGLTEALTNIYENRKLLKSLNENILRLNFDFGMAEHTSRILELYKNKKYCEELL